MRLRILTGTIVLVIGLSLYGFVVAGIGHRFLSQWPAAELTLYAIAGIVWIWPAARLTHWMQQAAPHHPPPMG